MAAAPEPAEATLQAAPVSHGDEDEEEDDDEEEENDDDDEGDRDDRHDDGDDDEADGDERGVSGLSVRQQFVDERLVGPLSPEEFAGVPGLERYYKRSASGTSYVPKPMSAARRAAWLDKQIAKMPAKDFESVNGLSSFWGRDAATR